MSGDAQGSTAELTSNLTVLLTRTTIVARIARNASGELMASLELTVILIERVLTPRPSTSTALPDSVGFDYARVAPG